jgi:hypothetical protein
LRLEERAVSRVIRRSDRLHRGRQGRS